MIKLNLGCGKDILLKKDGWINVDSKKFAGVDKKCDLDKALPFKSNTIDYILCSHIIEHLKDHKAFLKECWRILTPNATIEIKMPHKNSTIAYQITHKNYFSIYSFNQGSLNEDFVKEEIGSWKTIKNELRLLNRKETFLDKIINLNNLTKTIFDYTPLAGSLHIILQKN